MKTAHCVTAVLFIAALLMNGCTQDKLPTEAYVPDPPSPPTGSGVFMAIIDGSPWAAEDAVGIPTGTSTFSGNILHISGGRAVIGDTADAETIDLIIDLGASKTDLGPGTYRLGTIPEQEGEAHHSDGMACVCHTNSAHSGTVTITAIDLSRKIVSGIFDFDGIGVNGQTHTFRGGMFDITWK